jgi:hypothetical protein
VRRNTSRGAAAALLALLTTTSLAACGGDESSTGSGESSESSPTTGTSESADPGTEAGTAEESEAPAVPEPEADEQVIEIDGGVSFVAPEGWEAIKASDLAKDKKALELMAKEMSLSPEQALQALQASEAFVRAPKAQDGFTDNLNVTRVPASMDQFDGDAIASQMETLGMKGVEVSEIETPAGPGFRVSGDLQMATRGSVSSDGVFVGVGEEMVNITASTQDKARSAELIERVIETFSSSS